MYEEEHVRFWKAMVVVAEHELAEATRQEEIDRARVRGEAPPAHVREAGLHGSVDAEVQALIAGNALPCERSLGAPMRRVPPTAVLSCHTVSLPRCTMQAMCKPPRRGVGRAV